MVQALKDLITLLSPQVRYPKCFPSGLVQEEKVIALHITDIQKFRNGIHRRTQVLGHAVQMFAPDPVGILRIRQCLLALFLNTVIPHQKKGQDDNRRPQNKKSLFRPLHLLL